MNKELDNWISVSQLASILGISSQQVYNRIKAGLYETQTFKRGKMKGILVKYQPENQMFFLKPLHYFVWWFNSLYIYIIMTKIKVKVKTKAKVTAKSNTIRKMPAQMPRDSGLNMRVKIKAR